MVLQYFDHHAAYTTVRILIETPNENGNLVGTGTGFLYLANLTLNDGVARKKLLLISNKHVLKGGNGKMTICLNRKKDDKTPDYGNVKTFVYDGFVDQYFEHQGENVDLACVDVSKLTHSDAYIRHVDHTFLNPIDYKKVALGRDVLFVGYPNDFYDTVNNLPLVRKGTLASMPDIDFEGKGNIVIDAQVFEGSSGSPVFVDWDGRYQLLGVISSTMEGKTPSGVPAILGLGIVVKQRHVRELIEHTINEIKQALENIPRRQSS